MAGVFAALVGSVYAQEKTPAPGSGPTLKVEGRVSVIEAYTDNVFYTANDKRSDLLTIIRPTAALKVRAAEYEFTAGVDAEAGFYLDNTSEN